MAGSIVVLILIALGIVILLWWGTRFPPTRPRPGSRNRGETLMDVHKRWQKRRRPR